MLCRKLYAVAPKWSKSLSSIRSSDMLSVERFKDPDVLSYARLAVLHHNKICKIGNLRLVEIVKASSCTVLGRNYYTFILKVIEGRSIELFKSRVWVKALGEEGVEVNFDKLEYYYDHQPKDNICDSVKPLENTPEKN